MSHTKINVPNPTRCKKRADIVFITKGFSGSIWNKPLPCQNQESAFKPLKCFPKASQQNAAK